MNLRLVNEVYAVISLNDLPKIDFSEVGESSAETVRKNLLNPPTQFILKWNNEPEFIADGTVIPDGLYTHTECLELIATETWNPPEPDVEEK